jgi:hypothetical protein
LPADGWHGLCAAHRADHDTLAALDFILNRPRSNGSRRSLQADVFDQSALPSSREIENWRKCGPMTWNYETADTSPGFSTSRNTWNAHNPGRKISDSATLTVDIFDVPSHPDPDKQVAVWDALVALGCCPRWHPAESQPGIEQGRRQWPGSLKSRREPRRPAQHYNAYPATQGRS